MSIRPALSRRDAAIAALDTALRTLAGTTHSARPRPRPQPTAHGPAGLDSDQKRLSGALMRVNHVGEVCAQALYSAQALGTRSDRLKRQFERASREETDHLDWTASRLDELQARPSLLNPLWYAGAFAIGLAASRLGDAASLGFVVETEQQVERHLQSHLDRLPVVDLESRAIVEQMKRDEAAHAAEATAAGAAPMPRPFRWAMRAAARVMTATAHRI